MKSRKAKAFENPQSSFRANSSSNLVIPALLFNLFFKDDYAIVGFHSTVLDIPGSVPGCSVVTKY